MHPTIKATDQVIICKLSDPVQPGDVVVARGRSGLYAHRVRFVDHHCVITMGDNNALVDEPIRPADILGVARAKLVDGKAVPLDSIDFPPLVSFSHPDRIVMTVTGIGHHDRQQLTALAKILPFEIRYCPTVADIMSSIDTREYTIGICPQAPVSEAAIVSAIKSLPDETKVNFVLGAGFGYPGNALGLLPHNTVNMIARLGSAPLLPIPIIATAAYLIGLVQASAGQSGQARQAG